MTPRSEVLPGRRQRTLRRRVVASRGLAALAALALAIGGVLEYAERTTFRSEPFADRVTGALTRPPVRAAVAQRLGDAVIAVRPDLVTIRPLIVLAAKQVVDTSAFAALVHRAALDTHRSAFGADADRPALHVRDAGVLLAASAGRLRPDLAARIPSDLPTPVARVTGGIQSSLVRLAEHADAARRWTPLAFGAAVVLALATLAVSETRRAAARRLGLAVAVVSAMVVILSLLLPDLVATRVRSLDRESVVAVARSWLQPLVAWSAGAALIGVVLALGSASVVRPIAVQPLLRRVARTAVAWPGGDLGRGARAFLLLGLGVVTVLAPLGVLRVVVTLVGAGAVVAAVATLLGLASGPSRPGAAAAAGRRRGGGTLRLAATTAVLTVAVVTAAALASGGAPAALPSVTDGCNGSIVLCDRRLDQVALLGTHNSMAADREPGWLFPAQDTGIPGQLRDGIRALLIDTHYGFPGRRGVVTDLSGPTKSRAKLVGEVGEPLVKTAERLRARTGSVAGQQRKVYLCHAFCEVGATDAVSALQGVHRFLVEHPDVVLVLSIEDDTSPADTAAVIRRSGLVDEVYRGRAGRPWPTLGTLIERDERVLVLVENDAGSEPWMHRQPTVMQETPYRFTTAGALSAPASCAPNRGGTTGSLLLINNWVDTTPAPRVTIARDVNAADALEPRLAQCRARRRMLPNVVAVDFYRQGDAAAVVDRLNSR